MDTTIVSALRETAAFTEEDLAILEEAERGERGDVRNWSLSDFQRHFTGNAAQAVLARNIVREQKVGVAAELRSEVVLPASPPYLDQLSEYDPHDGAQFWTDPDTGEHWRWDGKGRSPQPGKSKITGETPPRALYPNGEPHRVALVRHTTVDGVRVPDEQEAHDANYEERDWFHHGYSVWIGRGGKPYGDVSRETRARFLQAQQRLRETGSNALVRRAPRVA